MGQGNSASAPTDSKHSSLSRNQTHRSTVNRKNSAFLPVRQPIDNIQLVFSTDFSFFITLTLLLHPRDRANFRSICKGIYVLRHNYHVFLGGDLYTEMLLPKKILLDLFASQFGLSHAELVRNFHNKKSLANQKMGSDHIFRGFVMDRVDQAISKDKAEHLLALALFGRCSYEEGFVRKTDEESILYNRKKPVPNSRKGLVFDGGIFTHAFPHLRSLLLENVLICQSLDSLALGSPLLEILKINNCTIENNPGFGSSFRRLDRLIGLSLILNCCNSIEWGLLLLPIRLEFFRFVVYTSCSVTIHASFCTQLQSV